MSLYSFFGCMFIAYGPLLSIFFLYISRDAQLVLLMVCSAFFWLIAVLLSSVIWFAAQSARDLNPVTILYSVILQEVFRWALFKLLNRAEKGLMIVSKNPKSLYNRSVFAFVAGFGFGLTSALVTYISTLVQMIGPGVIMCPSCPSVTLFFISAINTSLISLQHITWMMIAFEAYLNLPTLSGILQGTWVLISHFGVSYAMLLNASESVSLGCVYAIVVQLVILAISITLVVLNLKKHYGAAVFSRTQR
ncbi:unnamed protein product [Umbelopsis ramanniana]